MPNVLGSSGALTTYFAGRSFRPRLLPTLAAIVVVVLTISLGNWQRHRAAETDGLRAQYLASTGAAPFEVSGQETDMSAIRYQPVRARGTYDAAHQILVDNKIMDGRPGFEVVTPLRLDGGRNVLVDRGWVPVGYSRRDLPAVPPPAGLVVVSGRVNLPPARYLELSSQPNAGPLWQNLDIARVAAATGLPLAPYIIEQSPEPPAADGLVRRWSEPSLGSEQHRSYMMQWYSLAALCVVLWLTLNWEPRNGESADRR
jgi:surfeit locus 1 family protein